MTGQPTVSDGREALAQLAGSGQLSALDQRLIDAFDRLAAGQGATTDGALTIRNLCAEAGISRASYYRSPVVAKALAAGEVTRTEADILRDQVRELKRAEKELRRDHAAEVRDLRATVAAYANQIQALTLRNAEIESDNARLRAIAGQHNADIVHLTDHR